MKNRSIPSLIKCVKEAIAPTPFLTRSIMALTDTLSDWHAGATPFFFNQHDIASWADGLPNGPDLLLIHGFPTASWDWHKVWPALADRFRLHTADMIGFGYSDKPAFHHYSIFEQADMYEALLAERGVTEVHILAHDYGVTVAQELLERHNERDRLGERGLIVKSVVFLNGGLFPECHRARTVQKWLESPLGWLVSKFITAERYKAGLAEVFGPETKPDAQELDDFWTLTAHHHGQRIAHRLIGYMAERREHRHRWVGALLSPTVPLRLINGPMDPVSGRHLAEYYKDHIPNADVVLLKGIGHYPQTEAPQGVLDAFFAFHQSIGTVQ